MDCFDDDGVGLVGLGKFFGDLLPGDDLGARALSQEPVCFAEFEHLLLEGQHFLALEDAAHAVLLLAEQHVMTAAGRRVGGVQAAGAAARDQDAFFDRCRGDFHALVLAADAMKE